MSGCQSFAYHENRSSDLKTHNCHRILIAMLLDWLVHRSTLRFPTMSCGSREKQQRQKSLKYNNQDCHKCGSRLWVFVGPQPPRPPVPTHRVKSQFRKQLFSTFKGKTLRQCIITGWLVRIHDLSFSIFHNNWGLADPVYLHGLLVCATCSEHVVYILPNEITSFSLWRQFSVNYSTSEW